jgi:hypothetical protein
MLLVILNLGGETLNNYHNHEFTRMNTNEIKAYLRLIRVDLCPFVV